MVKAETARNKSHFSFNEQTISSWVNIILCVIDFRAFVSASASRNCSTAVIASSLKF